jgi:hypothetical protein
MASKIRMPGQFIFISGDYCVVWYRNHIIWQIYVRVWDETDMSILEVENDYLFCRWRQHIYVYLPNYKAS